VFNRTSLQAAAALASISLLAGCSLFSGDDADGENKIVVGTTSEPSTLDPAAAWDGSWELYRNVFQTLLSFPTGSETPQPDAADCKFTDTVSKVYECRLKEGLTFSDGGKLDARAVKHSIDRIRTINAKGGPAPLLGSLDKIVTSSRNRTPPSRTSWPRPPCPSCRRSGTRRTRCARTAGSPAPARTC
jgi:peptide/nickel transport system substrate-binding protein